MNRMAHREMTRNSLTLKQKRFIREYLESGGNGTAAVRKAYPNAKTDNTRAVMGHRLLRLPKVKERISMILDGGGISVWTLCQPLIKLLDAKKPLIVNGKIVDYYDDGMTQVKTAELLYKLHGVL